MSSRSRSILTVLLYLAVAVFLSAPRCVSAAPYPVRTCVARKVDAAAAACRTVFSAWAEFERSRKAATRATRIGRAAQDLTSRWSAAEAKAAALVSDCSETSGTSAEMVTYLDSAAGAFVDHVAGLGGGKACVRTALRAAASACRTALEAEGRLIRAPAHDPDRRRLAASRDRLRARLPRALVGCSASTRPAIVDAIDAALDQTALRLQTAPDVPSGWTMISPPADVPYNGETLHPICARGTPYSFWARRGTVNKLVVYFQGGGACFSNLTCSPAVGAFKDRAGPGDNPSQYTEGIANVNNPNNPFRDWNVIFVSYCTGDIHWGDATVTYLAPPAAPLTIHHRGAENARVVEKWGREHFVNPEEVFVTGSSAGAYGTIAAAAFLLRDVYTASRFNVVGDAGTGVVTQQFVATQLLGWGIEKNLPRFITALDVPDLTQLNLADLWAAVANFYPRHKFGQYTTAYDGGSGGQTFFYNVMVQGDDISRWLQWWLSSCDWHAKARAIVQDTAARAPNFRYYIGAGSRHTIWGSDKIYTETKGGVIPFVQWVEQMRQDDPAWSNQECTDCSLNPGDPRPNPPVPPFNADGTVSCPAS